LRPGIDKRSTLGVKQPQSVFGLPVGQRVHEATAHVAFGDAIRAIRKEQGVSQEAFALKCGLDRSYYGAVERGERNVSLTNILRIAEALETRPGALFDRAEDISPD
jgi:DNA-binding XRE family transcriptional regulator